MAAFAKRLIRSGEDERKHRKNAGADYGQNAPRNRIIVFDFLACQAVAGLNVSAKPFMQ